ncbi:DUF1542 domain-containing protein, partial [Streptococcus pseudopneumoniae]|uniref:DUF1542 domain-containing protein n=1 Tax=Streptococcus pseudopneumoniae TaxID=257758 RepID=UPI00141A5DCC
MFYSEKDDREKRLRFSIRKVSFGAASVAVAALYLFMGSGAVSAEEAQAVQSNEEVAADKDSETEKKSEEQQPTYAAPAAKEQGSATNTEAGDEDSVSGDSSSPKSEGEGTRSEEASSKPKVRKRRDAPAPTATPTDDDSGANQTYEAPGNDASVDDLATKLKDLPETVENEKKLAKIDEVGATKNITPGQVSDLDEFGGWKAVNGGKFGVARKTDRGVFPIETVNTVRTDNGKDKTWLNESSFDRSNNYALFLGLVRTAATKDEEVDDGSTYTQGKDYNDKGKGLKKFQGIEKTFKNYSSSTGSDVTVSFYTGITGDIDGNKAGYKVEVITKTAEEITTTIYNESFYPQNSNNNQSTINDENKIVTPVKVGRNAFFETDRSQTENKKDELTKKLEEESNKGRLGTSHGTFTSKKISLAPGVTEYTVRISAADNTKLGMGFQVPWKQYALPVVGNGFAVTQDTSKVAKDLAQKVYDKLTEQKEKDTKWSTSETRAAYEEKLNKIREKIDSGVNTSDYKTVVKEALEKRKQLNEEQQIKSKAKDAVDAKLKEKEAEIENNSKLSPAEKAAAKEQAKQAAEKAKQDITDANSQDEVTNKQDEGTKAIGDVNPIGTENAKNAIADAAARKFAEIEDNDKLSEDEKNEAKAKVVEAVTKAGEAIKKAKDAKNQGEVDQAQTTAISEVTAINPVGKSKAKDAVDAKLKEKEAEIENNSKLSPAEKAAAKEQAKQAAEKAKQDITDANSQDEVTNKQDEGTKAIGDVNPIGTENAKNAIADAAARKFAEIEDNDKLSEDEKNEAKAKVVEAVTKAGEAIKKAKDAKNQGEVDQAQTTAISEVTAINPVGKSKAKDAVDAKLKEKEAEIENNSKLSPAEKAAAKEQAKQAADKATQAIDAAS